MRLLNNGFIRLWMDPAVTGINKLPGHSSHRIFPEAKSATLGMNPWEIDLYGTWDFYLAPDPVAAEAVITGGKKVTERDSIRVPGHPEMQGFGFESEKLLQPASRSSKVSTLKADFQPRKYCHSTLRVSCATTLRRRAMLFSVPGPFRKGGL
jgi:hypothetical protein